MSADVRVYISRWALRIIENEARQAVRTGQVENETGGILIGRFSGNDILVVGATEPGPEAEQQQFIFAPDVAHSQKLLHAYHLAYTAADYVGTWHKHPLAIDRPSDGDLATACAIVTDTDCRTGRILAPIVRIGEDGRLLIAYYYYTRAMAATGEPFLLIPPDAVHPVGDRDQRLLDELTMPAQALYLRLSEENRLLQQSHFSTEVRETATGGGYLVSVRHGTLGGARVLFDVPPGYPRAAPGGIVTVPGSRDFDFTGRLASWWREQADRGEETSLIALLALISRRLAGGGQPDLQAQAIAASPDEIAAGQAEAHTTDAVASASRRGGGLLSLALLAVAVLLVGLLVGTFAPGDAQISGAVRSLTAITALPPGVASVWGAVDQARADGNLEAQVALLSRLLSDGELTAPDGESTAMRLFGARIELGDQLRAEGRYDEAIAVFRTAQDAADTRELQDRASAELELTGLLQQASTAYEASEFTNATAIYSQVLALTPAPDQRYSRMAHERREASQRLSEQLTLAEGALNDYQTAVAATPPAYPTAIAALERIFTVGGEDVTTLPVPPFPTAVLGAQDLRASARISYALALQLDGDFSSALAQLNAIAAAGETVSSHLSDRAIDATGTLSTALELWDEVNAGLSGDPPSQLLQVVERLQDLSALPGYSLEARNPDARNQSAGMLLDQLGRQLSSAPSTMITPTPTTQSPTTEAQSAFTQPAATPMPAGEYEVMVKVISREQVASLLDGTSPQDANAVIQAPSGLTVAVQSGGAQVRSFSSNEQAILLPQGEPLELVVIADAGEPTSSPPVYWTFFEGKHYLVSIRRLEQ